MELYAYHNSRSSARKILDVFIESVSIVNIDENIKWHAVDIRQKARLKLPDAIVAASARARKTPLVTADRDFKRVNKLDLILYEKK